MPRYTVNLPNGKTDFLEDGEKFKPGDFAYTPGLDDPYTQLPWEISIINHKNRECWVKKAPKGSRRDPALHGK